MEMNRREMIAASAVALGGTRAVAARAEWRPKKAVEFDMLPGNLSAADRFKLARDLGFDGVEVPRQSPQDAEKMRAAADAAGTRIHSIIFGGWDAPLSSPDDSVIQKGMENVRTNLHA